MFAIQSLAVVRDFIPWLNRKPKPKTDPVSVVLRHMGIPDSAHDEHVMCDSANAYSTRLGVRARTVYMAIYRSLSEQERKAAERML